MLPSKKFLICFAAALAICGFSAAASAASTYVITTGALGDSTAGANQRKLVRTSDGTYHAVYHKLNGDGYYQIYCADSSDGGQTWTETPLIGGTIVSSISHDNRPSIVSDSKDNLYVAWWGKSADSPTYNQIRFLKRDHASGSWGSIQTITNENYDQSLLSMTLDSSDNVYLAWNGKDAAHSGNTQIRFAEYSAASGTWGPISDLTAESYDQQRPFITVDYADNIHAVWYGSDAASPSYTQIRYAKYSSGSWSATQDLTSGNYAQDFVSLAVDSKNNVHVTWRGTDASSPTISQIKYVEYSVAGASWGSISTFSNEQYGRGQYNPYIAVDASDGVRIVWNGRVDPVLNNYSIRYVENLGSGWSAPSDLTGDAVDNQYANLIWYANPVINQARINRPKTGYAFIWGAGTTVYFYKSDDLSWDTPVTGHSPNFVRQYVAPPAPSVVIYKPDSSEMKPGQVSAVEWGTADGAFVKFTLSYSLDRGATWTAFAAADANARSSSWTAPAGGSGLAVIKIDGYGTDGALLASATSAPISIAASQAGAEYSPESAMAGSADIDADRGFASAPGASAAPCSAGSLIKGSLPAVYYCGADGKRHAFVNEGDYFSWYGDFGGVVLISDNALAAIPLGENVTYRPGKRLIKVQSDGKLYAVGRGGVLRLITEKAAERLYGSDWPKFVDILPEAFFADYLVGKPIS